MRRLQRDRQRRRSLQIKLRARQKMRPTTLSSVSTSELSQNTLCRPSDPAIAP